MLCLVHTQISKDLCFCSSLLISVFTVQNTAILSPTLAVHSPLRSQNALLNLLPYRPRPQQYMPCHASTTSRILRLLQRHPLHLPRDLPSFDDQYYDPKRDHGHISITSICPEVRDSAFVCLGMYVAKDKYVRGFDARLRTCMKDAVHKCIKWDAKKVFCANKVDVDNVGYSEHGKGDVKKFWLQVDYDGHGGRAPQYDPWYSVRKREVGEEGESVDEGRGRKVEKARTVVEIIRDAGVANGSSVGEVLELLKHTVQVLEEESW